MLVDSAVPKNTKKSTKYAVNVFELSFVFSINKLKVTFFVTESIYQATTVYNFRPIFIASLLGQLFTFRTIFQPWERLEILIAFLIF